MAQSRQVRSYSTLDDTAFAFEDCPSGSYWDLPQLGRLEVQHESGFEIEELLSHDTRPPPNGKVAQFLKSKTDLPWPQIIDTNAHFPKASFYAQLNDLFNPPVSALRKIAPILDSITPLPLRSMRDRLHPPRTPAKDQPRRPEEPKPLAPSGLLLSRQSYSQSSHSHTSSESSDISLQSPSRIGKDGYRVAPVVRRIDQDKFSTLQHPVKFDIGRPLQRQEGED